MCCFCVDEIGIKGRTKLSRLVAEGIKRALDEVPLDQRVEEIRIPADVYRALELGGVGDRHWAFNVPVVSDEELDVCMMKVKTQGVWRKGSVVTREIRLGYPCNFQSQRGVEDVEV